MTTTITTPIPTTVRTTKVLLNILYFKNDGGDIDRCTQYELFTYQTGDKPLSEKKISSLAKRVVKHLKNTHRKQVQFTLIDSDTDDRNHCVYSDLRYGGKFYPVFDNNYTEIPPSVIRLIEHLDSSIVTLSTVGVLQTWVKDKSKFLLCTEYGERPFELVLDPTAEDYSLFTLVTDKVSFTTQSFVTFRDLNRL